NSSQALTLSPEERLENMMNVFGIKNNKEIIGKNIILIDDVYTTGATLNEAAKTLKENGAKNIIGVTLAGQIY
ncbi:MAG: phosphoribosyltransferase family protein, partial [Candidatus Parcubacteria bacterium]|nr:phosphoribosyltransferase family protein [Candidatus Parcubacteria bacterium]